jgi:hypothetical protein
MSPLPATALAVTVAALALAPSAASADELRGSGSVHPVAPGTCERLAAPSPLVREDCADMQETFTGMLRSTEAATAAQRSWFSRSNAWFSGTERFVGCIGTRCGALTFRFRGGFVADLTTSTLRGGRTLVVTGGAGGLAGARGTIVQRFGEDAGYVATVRLRG